MGKSCFFGYHLDKTNKRLLGFENVRRNADLIYARHERMERKGFGLIEIIVAMVILTAVAVSTMGTIVFTKRSTTLMQQKENALRILEKKIIEIRTRKTGAVPLTYETNPLWGLSHAVMAYQVEAVESPADPHLFKVRTEMRWDHPWYSGSNPCSQINWDSCEKKAVLRTIYYKAA